MVVLDSCRLILDGVGAASTENMPKSTLRTSYAARDCQVYFSTCNGNFLGQKGAYELYGHTAVADHQDSGNWGIFRFVCSRLQFGGFWYQNDQKPFINHDIQRRRPLGVF